MLYILISSVSFIFFFSKYFSSYESEFLAEDREMVSSSHWLRWKISRVLIYWFSKSRYLINLLEASVAMPMKKKILAPKVENEEGEGRFSLLDLPELTLECILEHLSPTELCTMSAVSNSLRDRCRSDHLWEKHLGEKWGQLIGDAAYRQRKSNKASREKEKFSDQFYQKGLFSAVHVWPFYWRRLKSEEGSRFLKSSIPDDSIMALYLSLESGKLSFPSQVFNRENGHTGFLLSCYDAQLTYDSRNDTFLARYSPHGGWATEENIPWNRLRTPPMDLPPHDLYRSDCLYALRPGDHIEIQWRKSKAFPFGWWYGIVVHLDTCLGDQNQCFCRFSDTVILEFSQYKPGSRWRQAIISRRDHREHGNESDGFYGGIRKLENKEDIERWRTVHQSAS